jgi:adenylate cyclase
MTQVDRFWKRIPWILVVGNLVGALLTFVYFRVIDPSSSDPAQRVGPWELVYFAAGMILLLGLGSLWVGSWAAPLVKAQSSQEELSEAEAMLVRRRALLLPSMLALVTLTGWMAAGVIWGVLWPMLAGLFVPERAWRSIFGITVVAGSVSTAFTYLVAEHQWRRAMPHFFPRGDVSSVPRAMRLSVRARLLVIFLLISVIPLAVLGMVAYTRALSLAGAGAAAASHLAGELGVIIAFIVGVGIIAAIGLAIFTARSVADPLRRLQREMEAVGRGELDGRVPVVANDEIGAVGEGFNRMLEGLREREVIRETFGKYVTREVRDEILAGRASIDGQLEEVTVLFADLRDFTSWVERTEPREVVRDLNEYFTEMEGAIRGERGLVLQYIGDEIEAVFGAPLRGADHADRALRAAREMRRRLAELNARRAGAGKPPLRNGIGIHTGTVLAGNIGSAERLTYALVGDAVNLASRIQGLNKELGTDILLSDATRGQLSNGGGLETLPAVRVKGRSVEVSVFRVS